MYPLSANQSQEEVYIDMGHQSSRKLIAILLSTYRSYTFRMFDFITEKKDGK